LNLQQPPDSEKPFKEENFNKPQRASNYALVLVPYPMAR